MRPQAPLKPLSWDTSAAASRAAAAPHLKSPKRTGRAHEFFVGRERVSSHRELGEGAKGAAAARQSRAREQSRLAGETASGPQDFSPSNPEPPQHPCAPATPPPFTSFPPRNCKAARKVPGEPWVV